MRRALLAACLWALAGPVWALSCLPNDIARDFNRAAASEDAYIVVKGALFFDETALPKTDFTNQTRTPPQTDIPAWLDGHSLSQAGFDRRFQRDIILRVTCAGPWCGGAAKGPYLAFLKREGTSFVMMATACGSMSYPDPTPGHEARVLSCMRGEGCREDRAPSR
ncbi:hypothetical protein MWU54_16690 [Marivita sp. S6314]|uniref:hypothetical protein n=1 Tax=Marivita sp. S6314 TaxID=2926406 RepID=UPI001FF29E84|nr:hypothetical protein [Marivita sp. S6314]MCK0151682.1 hypothetical protein [Marivita sp. S6314]